MNKKHVTPNHLINETSPYLLQHAYNPVMWHPWGDEAFEKAKKENKPVFLSIGYSTCHWCHVMEKESFEDEDVAALLNKICVPIKVDREERPDIDHIYMTVCQVMTGSGGWPLNLFLTPDRKPFFAGTYFPKETRLGRVGLIELASHMNKLWVQENHKAQVAATQMVEVLQEISNHSRSAVFDKSIFEKLFMQLKDRYDSVNGGFGTAPKFPSPHLLMFLLRHYKKTKNPLALEMVEKTLDSMRSEGIYDHVGFGFHRYSTDEKWHLPHFEKMLYDQAMHIMAYTEAFQVTRKAQYKKVVEEIIEYLERDMLSDEGGFYSAEDADSEGEEGKCYVWTLSELRDVLGKDVDLFQKVFNVEDNGNFVEEATRKSMDSNIICLREPLENIATKENIDEGKLHKFIDKSVARLLEKRQTRIPPHKDDKILTDWNGLMIAALAKAGLVLKKPEYIELADQACSFILSKMTSEGKLMHSCRKGKASGHGNLDDYAFVIWGLIELYNATFKEEYLIKASELNAILLKHFWDEKSGGFYFMPDYAEKILIRKKEYFDGAIPGGNSVSVMNLMRLGKYFKLPVLLEYASKIVSACGRDAYEHPLGYSMLMAGLGNVIYGSHEIIVVGNQKSQKQVDEILHKLNEVYSPDSIKIYLDEDKSSERLSELNPVLKNCKMIQGKPTVYVCENYACKEPITGISELDKVLSEI